MAQRSGKIYYGLAAGQLITFVAYAVVTAGAALLQKRANNLPLWDSATNEAELAALQAAYTNVFQSTTYIIPYPTQSQYQFQYQWWIIQMQFVIFAFTAICTLFPALIQRMRPVALAFLSSALVLVMDNINAVAFLLRDATAVAVFEKTPIATTQAGLILVAIGNCLTIICMGVYQAEPVQQKEGYEAHMSPMSEEA
mmetsp:Transcript_25984/g.64944  ORF Transcript_25984/g.64944 Transcript_25984/m.64944 type:complete len:197 (+) Transcript_25984:111-701(+)